ncbi:UNVERIFIED_CONTAM: Histidine kinase CKI1 [Sesamum calycinum]|uniref:histidine kinase n=1 Tax=Sesamum calycinum TaxID=2727403 RepID=A0AAW2PM98_9LAMI
MKPIWKMLLRLLCFLILLGLSSFMILNLSGITEKTESNEVMLSERLLNASFSQIENAAKLLDPLDSCVANLARTLVLSLDGAELTFDAIKTKHVMLNRLIDTGKLNGQIVSCDMRHVTQNCSNGWKRVDHHWLSAKVVADHFDGLQFYGGDFQLAMSSGQVIVESKLEDTRIDVRNGTVSVETVYVLSFPNLESLAHKNGVLALVLLVCMLATIVISIGVFIIIILKSAKREMFLCDALIKQMESTQQAERKSMNKSLAFANASHDIRSSLAAISGILNSVLDTSKIEAGKMQLQEEEFNIAELLEDVVNMYYLLGMKKGVDMVFDPCDGSIFKFNLVRGDRAKLKQILCNLLNNATKFTSEGHISNKGSFNTLEGLHTIQRDSNCMEYIFDVDDTGKGIPKDKQESVFENFVQVRLMGGEIKILDKEQGERGTCFRFNVFFIACHHIKCDIEEQGASTNTNAYGYPIDVHHLLGGSLPPTRDGSRVILFLAGEERKRVSKRLIQSFGVKVLVVRNNQDLLYVLELIKKKRDLSLPSSETIMVDTLQKPSNNSNKSRPLSSSSKRSSGLILIVIDAKATSVSELHPVLANFRKEVQNCKFVWLENLVGRNNFEDDKTPPPYDHILSKPLHGSQLYHVLGLLPEFGGSIQLNNPEDKTIMTPEVHHFSQGIRYSDQVITVPIQKNEVEQVVIHETNKESINEQLPLNGKNVLVVDDHKIQLKLSATVLRKLGASPHVCENGKDAYDLMPVMDGFEATRLIREEEKVHGIHTPIIALTAYETPEEIGWTIEAGMDHHLVKPLQVTKVLELLQR